MSLMKKVINGEMYDVISERDYFNNPSLYSQSSAVLIDDNMIFPIRTKYDMKNEARNKPGAYDFGGFFYIVNPSEQEKVEYTTSDVIDFGQVDTLREYIQTRQRIATAERSILTSPDSIFTPEISPNDTPEMIALKQAIQDKQIDLDKYEPRFGPNYNNDKRLLKKESITFGKLRTICNALDIKATITFEDIKSDVPNPIGRSISADITGDSMSIVEEEDN